MNKPSLSQKTVVVVGLGYVGLPLALEFGSVYKTIGFDLSKNKIDSYKKQIDPMGEFSSEQFKRAKFFTPTNNPKEIAKADYIIVAVPTPVDNAKQPDFSPLIGASQVVGENMKKGAIIIYESTVYPGATEEICVPIIEKYAKLKWLKDFNVGYSPERINPGDKNHTLTNIVKIVSGDTPKTLSLVQALYGSIIKAGVHPASSIKVAEAAKVIENTQRDLNIALMNELSIIFDKIGIDTTEVLEAAGTKWNFLKFKPGLVGGHCIGVDPYYLTHKAGMLGYLAQVILAGRRINDGMGKYIAEKTVKLMIQNKQQIKDATVIIIGITFKENCADIRNSRVIDVIHELQSYGINVVIYDPVADSAETEHEYGVKLTSWDKLPKANAIVVAVAHKEIIEISPSKLCSKLQTQGCVVDVKTALDKKAFEKKGVPFWRL